MLTNEKFYSRQMQTYFKNQFILSRVDNEVDFDLKSNI